MFGTGYEQEDIILTCYFLLVAHFKQGRKGNNGEQRKKDAGVVFSRRTNAAGVRANYYWSHDEESL